MKLKDIRPSGILFDLDGVIYNGEEPIPGAAEAVERVERAGIPYLFVTNTTSRPRTALVEKLRRFGVETTADRIWTPPAAARRWLQGQPRKPVALFVPAATRAEFDGLEILPEAAESGAGYVVVGDLGEGWDFAVMNRAFRLLHSDAETRLLALGMTRYWRSPTGISLDAAPFVVALEHAADRKAVVLGKPSREFFRTAAETLGCPPEDLLMVGDDIRADIGGAQATGLRAALVKTGKFRPEDLRGEIQPDIVMESVAELGMELDRPSEG